MHEIVLQNITTQDKKRRDLVIEERLERQGVCAASEKHFTYLIRSRKNLFDPSNCKFADPPKPQIRPHHYYIRRSYDTAKSKGEYSFTTKADLYIVAGVEVFYVTIIYSIKVDISSKQQAG